MDNIQIFGFSGKIGAGKDYVAKNIFAPLLDTKKVLFLAFREAQENLVEAVGGKDGQGQRA